MRTSPALCALASVLFLCQTPLWAAGNQAGMKPLDRRPGLLPNGKRPVALTFDDGPSGRTTPRVLEVLQQHRIPGCFFVIGRNADTATGRQLMQKMIREGHTVGNHTQTHPASKNVNCATLSPDRFANEVRTAGGIILNATGQQPKFFRFPGGYATQSKLQQVKSMGYGVSGWHTDPWDWWGGWKMDLAQRKRKAPSWMPKDKIDNFVDYAVWAAKVNKGGLFLLHDIKDMTANQLDLLVTKMKQANFEFVPVTDTRAFPVMNQWANGQ